MSITTIEWTKRPGTIGETWNPTTGCNKVDRGCKNCYAEIMHRRLQAMGQEKYAQDFLKGAVAHEDTLEIPLRWKKPRTVFVNSMSDLFHPAVPFEFIRRVFQVIEKTPQHTYLVLTKRPETAVHFWLEQDLWWKPPVNLWMGTSANDQESANTRIPLLLKLTDCLLFLSYEPATGPVNLRNLEWATGQAKHLLDGLGGNHIVYQGGGGTSDICTRLNWVIAGGESGPKAEPSNPVWFRNVRDDCKATGVPFFFKQHGLWHPLDGHHEPGKTITVKRYPMSDRTPMYKANDKSFNILDGEIWQQFPEPIKQPTNG